MPQRTQPFDASTIRPLMEEVKRRLMLDPDRYDQNIFCGSPCCIAGHIDTLVNGLNAHLGHATGETITAACIALNEASPIWLFGATLDNEMCEKLLEHGEATVAPDPDSWPADLSLRYLDAQFPAEQAAVACDAIDRWLAEKGY